MVCSAESTRTTRATISRHSSMSVSTGDPWSRPQRSPWRLECGAVGPDNVGIERLGGGYHPGIVLTQAAARATPAGNGGRAHLAAGRLAFESHAKRGVEQDRPSHLVFCARPNPRPAEALTHSRRWSPLAMGPPRSMCARTTSDFEVFVTRAQRASRSARFLSSFTVMVVMVIPGYSDTLTPGTRLGAPGPPAVWMPSGWLTQERSA
jgi:hypothetical protein